MEPTIALAKSQQAEAEAGYTKPRSELRKCHPSATGYRRTWFSPKWRSVIVCVLSPICLMEFSLTEPLSSRRSPKRETRLVRGNMLFKTQSPPCLRVSVRTLFFRIK
ncbi:MAG: hypothetical protein EA402_05975 [Planctomycetota bacterium]|nr:MAG: hypothetical protein EA402_05975 [Planctomycetota bacterium]